MNPSKVERNRVKVLTDLPNIGKASAADLRCLGISRPAQLIGLSPYAMFDQLRKTTGMRHDPCMVDMFISITRFINGEAPQVGWAYTTERKQTLSQGGRI